MSDSEENGKVEETNQSENFDRMDAGIRKEDEELTIGVDMHGNTAYIYGRPIPDHLRCVARRKNCDCGYHFKKTDKGDCPECGRPRMRCRRPKMKGANTCRSHGAKGYLKMAFVPLRLNLDDEEIKTLEEMRDKDDITLRDEFHLLRLFFGKSIAQLKNALHLHEETGQGDIIGLSEKLAAMLLKLSVIAERREKIKQLIPVGEQVMALRFEDPRVQFYIKEAIRDTETRTIRRVLAALLHAIDPVGEFKLAEKIPVSFWPYLPKEALDESVEEMENADSDSD